MKTTVKRMADDLGIAASDLLRRLRDDHGLDKVMTPGDYIDTSLERAVKERLAKTEGSEIIEK